MASCARLCTLMVHTTSHFAEDLMLNSEIFADYAVGDIVQIFDPDRASDRLVLKVQSAPSSSGRVEISLSKVVAESLNFKPFVKVIVEKIAEQEASISFVEFVFKRQYLPRGNMWRFKTSMFGRPVYMGQNVSTGGMQAQILQLRNKTSPTTSGIITEKTKFIFRSRSSRIIWLVQISAEMWEFDQNGVLYFEKFLSEFVSPILDSWKALGVSHMLTVVFFSRTLYLERINATTHPDLYGKKSLLQNSDGLQYQDYYRIVLENIADIDKVAHIKKLRQEFWAYPRVVDWKIAGGVHATYSTTATPAKPLRASPDSLSLSAASADEVEAAALAAAGSTVPLRINTQTGAVVPPAPTANASNVNYAVPSDAVHGNFLEAINTSLNILDKHYMDRDLTRTGNAIVMISAGSGIFKVKPVLSQITKQRMIDGGIGLDFISLSRPSVNVVPLFLVDCRSEGVKDFYETPYWIRVSYVDCHKETSANLDSTHESEKYAVAAAENPDKVWARGFMPQPISTLLTAQLMNSGDLKSLAKSYANALPMALKELLLNCSNVIGANSVNGFDIDNPRFSPTGGNNGGFYELFKNRMIHFNDGEIPIWGKVPTDDHLTKNALSKLSGRSKPTTTLNDLPILKRDRADSSVVDSQSSSLMVDDEMMMEYQLKNSSAMTSRTVSKDEYEIEDRIIDDFEFHKATSKGQQAILNRNENRNIGKPALSISASVSTDSLHSAVVHFDTQTKQQSGSHTPVHRKHPLTSQQSLEYTTKQQEILSSLSSVALVASNKQQLIDMMTQHDDIVARSAFRAKGSDPLPPSTTTSAESGGTVTPASATANHVPGLIPIPSTAVSGSTDAAMRQQQAAALAALRPAPIVIDTTENSSATAATAAATKKTSVSPRMSALAARSNPTFDRRKMMMMAGMNAGGPFPASQKSSIMSGLGPKAGASGAMGSGPSSHAAHHHESSGASSAMVIGSFEDKSLENQLKNDPTKRVRLTNKNFVSKSHFVSTASSKERQSLGGAGSSTADKSKSAVGGAGGGNQEWMIQHGKIIPLPPSKNKMNEERIKLIREYCDASCINPFRPKEGTAYLQSITHNRRRWSHVFPSGAHEYHVDYGLNWKSLTQPAILPINTDYMPNVTSLTKGYDIQNFYQLLIDKHECPFPTPESLMQEMIASRVTREFQLIEGIDMEPFIKFNKHNIAGGGTSSRAVIPSALRRDKGTPAAADMKNKTFFILSMGHRIQFLDYDAENSQVNVTQYRSKKGQNNDDESNTYTYHYELWTPQSNRFQSMTQTFYQFPNPELKWNKIDNIIMGNIPFEAVDDGTKARRLRYTIFPEQIAVDGQIDDYFSKLDQLFEFLGKYNNNSDTIQIKKHRAVLEFNEIESLIDEWMASSYSSTIPVNTIPIPINLLGAHARSNSGTSAIGSRSGGSSGGGTLTPQSLSRVGSGIPSLPPSERGIALSGLAARSNSGTIHFPSLSATSSRVNVLPPATGATPPATPANVPSTNSLDGIVLPTVTATATPTKGANTAMTPLSVPTPPSPNGSANYNTAAKNPLAPSSISLYQKATTYPEVLKMNMKGANKENPNWMYMIYEHDVYTYKTYHLEFHWLVCDSWLIDEFIQLLFRRCHKFGLRLVQTPEYFSTPNLNIHPFRAQPYIVVPTIANIPWEHSSEVRLIERLYFRRSVGWLYDTEQITDWNGLGVPVPNYDERDRDIYDSRPPLNAGAGIASSGASGSTASGVSSTRPTMVSGLSKSLEQPSPKPAAAAPIRVWGKSRSHKDRQYIHHMGLATVRVAAQGFIWLSNASAKISDINLNADDKKEMTNKKMLELDRFCHVAVACYDVVLDVVASALSLVDLQPPASTEEVGTPIASERGNAGSPCPGLSSSVKEPST